jgi:hypothetical protein
MRWHVYVSTLKFRLPVYVRKKNIDLDGEEPKAAAFIV